jgi:hypothetical protein
VEKPSGRHRKPVQGWAQQVRWLVGAVLAAVLCSNVSTRQEGHPLPSRRTGSLECGRSLPRSRGAATQADRPRRESARCAASSGNPGSGPVKVPRPRKPHPSEQGWCVDDDGVRGVRPYLFRESNEARRRERTAAVGGPGEFDELAGLVRTWVDMRG